MLPTPSIPRLCGGLFSNLFGHYRAGGYSAAKKTLRSLKSLRTLRSLSVLQSVLSVVLAPDFQKNARKIWTETKNVLLLHTDSGNRV